MSGKKIPQGQYLFREGDPPDAMYVVKSGKLAVTKTKANAEINLAEVGPGGMVGEMAFFDNKPRSASAKALKDTEVIGLPYKALHAQFAQFPEWAKAIMRTVNNHLRTANARIKTLEKGGDEEEVFPPHLINKLTAILAFVAHRYGERTDNPKIVIVPGGTLRNFTIQVFLEATNKMQKLLNVLASFGYASVEDLGEGKQRITVKDLDFIFQFAEWHNEWLFKKETDRVVVKEEQLEVLDAVLEHGRKAQRNDKGQVKLNLTEIQSQAAAAGKSIKPDELEALVTLGFLSEKMMESSGVSSMAQIDDLEKIVPNWKLIYALKKVAKE